jgi:anaerobic magnesium-protoporphyrin IX monomethyl ester cyclase
LGMLKIVIVDSPSWPLFNPRQFLHLGILYLASSLESAQFDVSVLDVHEVTSWDKENHKLILHPEKMPACDVLCISATTANVHWGQEMAIAWPARYKVLGGSHATNILRGPHERFKKPSYFHGFDYMILEEAEESLVQFCQAVDKGIEPRHQLIPQIPDLCWFDSLGNLHRNPHVGLPDVTKLPRPAFRLWNKNSKFFGGGLSANGYDKKFNLNEAMTASLFTARGCPYGCRFCADARTKVREETLDQIEEDIRTLAELGVSAIRIQDDVPTIRAERCRAICDLMDKYGMRWRVNTRVNLSDRTLFKYMMDHGCVEVAFGVEHGSAKMLKLMDKGTTPEKNTQGIHMVQDLGMVAKAFLMLGFPGEDVQTVEEMKQWIITTKPSACAWCLFQPFPGSDVWNNPDRYGVSLPDNAFDRFWQLGKEGTDDELVLTLPTITRKDLQKARIEVGELIDREIGHRDRRRVDTGGSWGMGTNISLEDSAASIC